MFHVEQLHFVCSQPVPATAEFAGIHTAEQHLTAHAPQELTQLPSMDPVELGREVIDQKHTIPALARAEQSALRKLHGGADQLLLTAGKHFGGVDPAKAHPDIGPMRPTLGETTHPVLFDLLGKYRFERAPAVPATLVREFQAVETQQFTQRLQKNRVESIEVVLPHFIKLCCGFD